MRIYGQVCQVIRFNRDTCQNDTVYFGAIYQVSHCGSYPVNVPDFLLWTGSTTLDKTQANNDMIAESVNRALA
jgi:hypothetical protein